MDPNFWLARWENNHLGWHQEKAHPLLVTHLQEIVDGAASRIFVPLCGKTLDIGWLLSQGYQVVGAELSEIAIQQLFEEASVAPEITAIGPLKRYSAPQLDIYVGDVFELKQSLIGPVDAVYDRAAMVALPAEMRQRYTQHLAGITKRAPQLLISFEYDQDVMQGPPFSVPHADIAQLYGDNYAISLLSDQDLTGGLKGICPAREQAWKLAQK
ncbi:thiopurine S-methyltransferase [Roseovarius sp. EL26]|uniref:thiopurine S-methyltransferase n=1 Tax=Roseovarius sp. EL26 TaxID=2126672 RepID=UPI000EA242D5|nr:thiopurine S-methyltransferase [Roseovarius sp. EL26]